MRQKIYLDTDGGGWAASCDLSQMATKVEPIDYRSFPTEPDPYSCQKLHIPLKETPVVKDPKCPNDVTVEVQQVLETKVEMPMLDDQQLPRAIIVPFKSKQHLYSIASPNSAGILVEYYDLSMKCIGKNDQKSVKSFNAAYFNWLSSYILPHIQQLKTCPIEWYPGFGGAMRVVDTISRNGLTPSGDNRNYGLIRPPPKSDDYSYPVVKPPPKSSESNSDKNSWLPGLPKIGRPSLPTLHRLTLPTLGRNYFLMPLLAPLIGCLLLYALYLLYKLCCPILFACLCCRWRSGLCRTDNNQQPLLTLYYRCLESLNGLKKNPDDMPDYDSIAAASGMSARSFASSQSEVKSSKSCGMCQWIGMKEKTPEQKLMKKKKKKRKIDSEVSN
ncbi:hypothetical protein LSTR_LSTR015643 [Laodelphax striatellus]|uniref:Uncharacterized protein n=1 Tax=Laodelphax striatellus TaxID=195883 RepID=A0A482XK43_LAOST|nr:hypothetical protein LSTR_LSTR015643 [Laodelphax striatellus]